MKGRSIMSQHTVIIGGTAGIGLATAQQLAAEGHRVTVAGRNAERAAAAVAALAHPEAQAVAADLTDRASLDAMFARLGPIDHLVVTAPGTGGVGTLAELDLESLDRAFSTKFLATAHAVQAALPTLAKTGSITLLSAGSAQAALPGTAGLAAVNGAVEALVPTLALELAPIRVNAVAPGVVDTAWWDRVVPADQRAGVLESFVKQTPVGRNGRAEDIADAIALLVRNGFITGIVIPVDGGFRLKQQ
jgi:NAD(P)-dependent dehydrogenase (short-subunit alcohol dehydrogenase family)